MANPKLSVIIVNYRSSDVLEHCLRSLHVATGASLEVILVDNSPQDGAKEVLQTSGFHGHHFPQTENIGFSKGANLGAQHASGEILCFTHPDVLFEASGLDRMIAWVEQHPRSVVGPRQRNGTGDILTTAQPPMNRRMIWGPAEHQGSPWPNTWHSFMAWLHPSLQYAELNRKTGEPQIVPVLNSSCLVMPRSIWEEVGEWNETLNFVGLESEWFSRAVDLGILAWYLPAAEVFHQQAVSVARADGWRVREVTDHDRRWYAKRFGVAAVAILLIVIWFERKLRPNDAA